MTGVILLCERLFEINIKKIELREKSENFNLLKVFLEYFSKKNN